MQQPDPGAITTTLDALARQLPTVEMLRQSDGCFATLFQALPVAVAISRADDGTYLEVNTAFERVTGYTREEVAGKSSLELGILRTSDRETALARAHGRTGIRGYEMPFYRKTGERRVGIFAAQVIESGGQALLLTAVNDITERQVMAQALRESEAKFRALAASSASAIFIIKGATCCYVNQRLVTFTGYTQEELLSINFLEMIHPDYRALILTRALQRLHGEDVPSNYEVKVVGKSGEIGWIDYSADLIEYEGEPAILGTAYDITERKRVEEALRASEEAERQFKEALKTLHDIRNALSRALTVDALCRQAVKLGQSRLGFDRLSIWFVTDAPDYIQGTYGIDEQGKLRDERKAFLEVHPESAMGHILRKKARVICTEETPLRDQHANVVGHGTHVVAAIWDGFEVIGCLSMDNLTTTATVSERQCELLELFAATVGHLYSQKRTEQALRQREEQYRAIFETIQDVYFRMTLEGKLLLASPSLAEVTGYQAEEIYGHHALAFQENPEDYQNFLTQMQTHGSVRDFEFQLPHKSGKLITLSLNAHLITDSTGGPMAVEGTLRDITARKHAEMELRRTNRALRVLKEFNDARLRAADETALLQELCMILVKVGGYRLAWVGVAGLDPAKCIRPVASAGYQAENLDQFAFTWGDAPIGRYPTGQAIRNRHLVVVRDVQTDPTFIPWRPLAAQRGYASLLALPLTVEGELYGALTIYATDVGAFDVEEVSLLTELSEELTYGITALRLRAQRQLAEQTLTVTRARLQHLLISTPAVIYSRDIHGGSPVTFISDNVRLLLGYEPSHFLHDPGFWFSHIHPDDAPHVHGGQVNLHEPGVHTEEYRFQHRDGIYRWMRDEFMLVPNNEAMPEIVGCLVDITDHKFMEDAFHEADDTITALMHSSPLPIVTLDLIGRVTGWSAAAEEAFGWSEQEVLGYLNPLIPEEQQTEFLKLVTRGNASGDATAMVVSVQRKEAAPVYMHLTSAPIITTLNEQLGYTLIFDTRTMRDEAAELFSNWEEA